MNKKIPVFDIALGEKEKEYIKDCVDTSFIGQGPYVKKLEEKFIVIFPNNDPGTKIITDSYKSLPKNKFKKLNWGKVWTTNQRVCMMILKK